MIIILFIQEKNFFWWILKTISPFRKKIVQVKKVIFFFYLIYLIDLLFQIDHLLQLIITKMLQNFMTFFIDFKKSLSNNQLLNPFLWLNFNFFSKNRIKNLYKIDKYALILTYHITTMNPNSYKVLSKVSPDSIQLADDYTQSSIPVDQLPHKNIWENYLLSN